MTQNEEEKSGMRNEEFRNAERFGRLRHSLADLSRKNGASEQEVQVIQDLLGFVYSVAMSLERIGAALEESILRESMERKEEKNKSTK